MDPNNPNIPNPIPTPPPPMPSIPVVPPVQENAGVPSTSVITSEHPKGGFVKTPLILIFMVLLGLGAAYLYLTFIAGNNKSNAEITPTPTPEITQNFSDTTDWVTYTNIVGGFYFKHPRMFFTTTCKDGVQIYTDADDVETKQQDFCDTYKAGIITVTYSDNDLSLIPQGNTDYQLTEQNIKISNISANLTKAVKTTNIEGSDNITYALLSKDQKYYLFSLNDAAYEDNFLQILDTFSFIATAVDE